MKIKWVGDKRYSRGMRDNEQLIKKEIKKQLASASKIVRRNWRASFAGRLSDAKSKKRTVGGSRLGTFSGRYKAAISYSVKVASRTYFSAEIGPLHSRAWYAVVHEYGLKHWPARPMAAKALKESDRAIMQALGKTFRRVY